jgi:hypothetical protein
MDRFVARANINNFRDRLRSETDATARSVLHKLLVKEEDKLAADLELLDDLRREIAKCQEWIRNQQERIATSERDGRDVTASRVLLHCVTETLIIHQEYHQRVATRLALGAAAAERFGCQRHAQVAQFLENEEHRTCHSRKVKKLKRLIGRSVVRGQHSGAEGVPVHFLGRSPPQGIGAKTPLWIGRGLRHRDGGPLLGRNEYQATVREHQSAFQLVFQGAVFAERATLGEIGHRLVRKVLAEVATV